MNFYRRFVFTLILLAGLVSGSVLGDCDGGSSDLGTLSCSTYKIKDGQLYWFCGGD